jgi:hypothetical protein
MTEKNSGVAGVQGVQNSADTFGIEGSSITEIIA